MKKDRIHITETPDVSDIRNEDITHEVSDVNTRHILWFVLSLAALIIVSMVILKFMVNFFEASARKAEGERPPMARTEKERLKATRAPRLQGAPGYEVEGQNLELREPQAEMKVVHEKWEKELNSYGWVDQQNGVVRIPIEQAKKMIAEKGIQPIKPQGNTEQNSNQQSSGQQQPKPQEEKAPK